jgi:hypothetical protein
MSYTFRWAAPAVILLVAVPLLTAQKKPDADKDKPQTKEKMLSSGSFVGKLVSAESSTKNFTVQVDYYEPDQDKILANSQYDAKRTLEISLIRNNPAEKQRQYINHQIEMAKRANDQYKKLTKNVELVGTESLKVRTMILPIEYDDKGKPKKYTKKELAAMKGPNKRLSGYTAEFDSLHADQKVRVSLAKVKKDKSKNKNKNKDKDKANERDLFEERLPATMIVILAEPPMK